MKKRIFYKLTDVITSQHFSSTGEFNLLDESTIERLKRIKSRFYKENMVSTFHSFCKSTIENYRVSSKSDIFKIDLDASVEEGNFYYNMTNRILLEEKDEGFKNFLTDMSATERNKFLLWLDNVKNIYEDNNGNIGLFKQIYSIINAIELSGKSWEEWEFREELINKNGRLILGSDFK